MVRLRSFLVAPRGLADVLGNRERLRSRFHRDTKSHQNIVSPAHAGWGSNPQPQGDSLRSALTFNSYTLFKIDFSILFISCSILLLPRYHAGAANATPLRLVGANQYELTPLKRRLPARSSPLLGWRTQKRTHRSVSVFVVAPRGLEPLFSP